MADVPFVSLYRRFRPGRFDELRGQDHVVRALRSAVRDDRVSHAYLFSGPRGTGKTSSARILAKALNCESPVDGEPCGVCTSCVEITQGSSLNVHELDAASNNGVDAMRDLVAHAGLGTPGRWKVYIVDEVHMLSTAAANALLKTLEEPPSHVVFVLATTDPQKVPPTIRSRTQHLEFRLLGAETLHNLLETVNEEAGLQVDEESLEAAVRRGRGSARDALSALDQVVASGSADAARPELGAVLDALSEGDVSQVLVALSALLAGGWGPQQLATELIDDLRQVFLAALAPELCTVSGASLERFRAVAEAMGLARVVRSMEILGHALVDMREAPDAQVVLEIGAVRAVRPDLDSGMEALSERVSVLERAQSGAPAFPRPGATPARGAPVASADGAPTATAHRSPRRHPDRRPRWPGDPRSVQCGAARKQPHQRNRRRPPPLKRRQPWSPSPSPRRPQPAARTAAAGVGGVCPSGSQLRGSRAGGCDEDARSRRPHRGLGRRHPPVPAGKGQGALRQRTLRGGGRAGRPLRVAQRRAPGAVRRTAGRRREGSLRPLRDEGCAGAPRRRQPGPAGSGSRPVPCGVPPVAWCSPTPTPAGGRGRLRRPE